MATVRDVAKEAGVSVGTASRSLTGNGYVAQETRELVLDVAKRMGYTPKERIRPMASSKSIGVIIPDITFPFYGNFLKYTEVELGSHGYKTIVYNTLGVQNRVSAALDLLEKNELDGLILNADVTKEEIARMEKLPVVSLERMLNGKIPMVSSDHRQGGRLAAKALIDSCCKNVLILTAKHANPLYGDLRITDCEALLKAHGVFVTVIELAGTMLSYRYARDVVGEYLSLYNQTDGIFTEDLTAYCCVFEAVSRGIAVPEQLKIVGYDGNEIGQIITPQITTIVQNVPELTHTCVDILLRRIKHEQVPPKTIIPVAFRQGATT